MPASDRIRIVVENWEAPFPEDVYREACDLFYERKDSECISFLESKLESNKDCISRFTIGNALVLLCRCLLAADKYTECVAIYRQLESSPRPSTDKEILKFWIWCHEGKYKEIEDECTAYLSIAPVQVDLDLAELFLVQTAVQMNLGNYDQAEICADNCLALFRIFGMPANVAKMANAKGLLAKRKGRIGESIVWFNRAAILNAEHGYCRNYTDNQLNLGVAYYKVGKLQMSVKYLTDALKRYIEYKCDVHTCRTLIALGNALRLRKQYTDARKYLTEAYTVATSLRIPREECLALEYLGDVVRDEGMPEEGRRYYARGKAIAITIAPNGDLAMELKRREGECLVLQGKVAFALPILTDARRHAVALGDRFEEGVAVRCLAEAMLAIRDSHAALRFADEACAILGEIEARLEHMAARIVAINALLTMSGNLEDDAAPRDLLDRAWDHALIAQSLAREVDDEHWADSVKRLQSTIARRRVEAARYAAPAVKQPGDTYAGKGVIIAESRAMREVLQAIDAFAPYDEALLIMGETGTGKEIVARRVHELSTRREGNFVAVNVTAVPTSMFEREFFGHRRGAFSGADNDSDGYAAEANNGTLFLDEIGDMAKETQAKLLRLLQDGSYTVLGNPDERRTNLRVIAATNKDLELAVSEGKFREDLYYRLRILEINIPPLRKHPEDILPLLEHFLSQSAGRRVAATDYFNRTSLNLMQHYPWPGNAREVSMVARRAHITLKIDGKVLVELGSGRDALVLSGPGKEAAAAAAAGAAGGSDELSRARLVLAIEEAGGNRTEAAKLLGISRGALYRRLERFGLD